MPFLVHMLHVLQFCKFLKSWLTTDVEVAVDVCNINSNCIEPGKTPVVSQQSSHVGCGVM
jgi:hypothetical protein